MSQNRTAIDPDVFTDAQGARELEANAIRATLAYDAYGDQTEFTVLVLTTPIPSSARDADAVLRSRTNESRQVASTAPIEGGISFKGRIIGNGFISPHASIPNPCNIQRHQSPGSIIKIINLHTTFYSVTGYQGRIPTIGDTVTVKLQAGDIKFNLQTAVFSEISDSADGSAVANSLADQCTNLASTFQNFDPDTDLGDIDLQYQSNNEGGGVANISIAQAQPLIDQIMAELKSDPSKLGYTPLDAGKCGFPADFFGSSPSAAQQALMTKYAVTNCVTRQIGHRPDGLTPAHSTGHPVWIATLQDMYNSATQQPWWQAYVAANNGAVPISFSSGYRSIETQIYLRMVNGGHRTYAQVMSSPTSPSCDPPTARPGKSRHNLGLAMDFGGPFGVRATGHAHESNRWLQSKSLPQSGGSVHSGGNGTYDMKNYQKESWHWSVDGY